MSNGSIWFVYILKSPMTGKLYTGITNNVGKRLEIHNNGTGAKFTRAGRPWVLVYQMPVGDKGSALRRELKIKSLSRAQKLTLILDQTLHQPRPLAQQLPDDPPEQPVPATERS